VGLNGANAKVEDADVRDGKEKAEDVPEKRLKEEVEAVELDRTEKEEEAAEELLSDEVVVSSDMPPVLDAGTIFCGLTRHSER